MTGLHLWGGRVKLRGVGVKENCIKPYVTSKSAHVSSEPPAAAARINYYALGTHLLLLYMAFAVTDRRSYIAVTCG